ncbi:MAG TPA: alpha/beta fold hydrolase [Pseudonocardiaceae bacterium]|mgnify:CR=1 FL=1
MTVDQVATGPAVREIVLDAGDGLGLSALLAEPHRTPRAVLVALHGGGMRAGYFHSRVHPGLSLLDLGTELGFTVLAVDRPGYGHSAGALPQGQRLAEQARTVRTALDRFAAHHPVGAGFLLVGHSYGGKLALRLAADWTGPTSSGAELLGLDISGCGHRLGPDAVEHMAALHRVEGPVELRDLARMHWGPVLLYPPGTFVASQSLTGPMPPREAEEVPYWPQRIAEVAARVRVPVRFTFAEHEHWWRHDPEALDELAALLPNSPRVTFAHQPNAGHNISLGWAARPYHLRVLAFAEECVQDREQAPAGTGTRNGHRP